jgi:hypothetical protein
MMKVANEWFSAGCELTEYLEIAPRCRTMSRIT